MLVFTIFGLLICIVGFSTLVVGDPTSVVTINSIKVTNNPNDYFDPWTADITKSAKSSILTMKIPTKKELPDSMQFKISIILQGQEPIDYEMSVCDAMNDEMIGKSFVNAGTPKGQFPQKCPFTAGDWTVLNWDPPANMIPPGIPDGPFNGFVLMAEEGKEPYVKLDFEGALSHAIPGFGR